MGQTKDFRTRSSAPSTPPAGVVTYWVNTSGSLQVTNEFGTSYGANQLTSNTISMLNQNVTTGFGYFPNTIGTQNVTGVVIGSTGTYRVTTILGVPAGFIPIVGPSGEAWCIPAYARA